MFGLTGIGYAFIIHYFIYFIIVYVVSMHKYKINYCHNFWILFILLTIAVTTLYLFTLYLPPWCAYIFVLLISLYSFYEINKRINVINLLHSVFKLK